MINWNEAIKILHTARFPTKNGKKLKPNTYLILDGTFEEPKQIRIKYHRTDIIILKPNGDRLICTGWDTVSTIERLIIYTGVHFSTVTLPSLNGYKIYPEKAKYMGNVPFSSPYGYIRIDKNNKIDLDTVRAIEVNCIIEPEKLRRVMTHLGKVSKLILGMVKLNNGENPFQDGNTPLNSWFLERIDIPLEEIQLSPQPMLFRNNDDNQIKNDIKRTLNNLRWQIARTRGWTSKASIPKVMDFR